MPKRWALAAGCAGGACLLYFLSVGPVLRLTADTRLGGVADSFYAPVLDHAGWAPVRGYLQLWGLYHPIADASQLPRPKQ